MSAISARLGVTTADSPIRAYMTGSIPVIEFNGKYDSATFEVLLNNQMLTPAEQAAWLRTLAAAAQALAVEVEALAEQAVA